jgi:hypothetical protein
MHFDVAHTLSGRSIKGFNERRAGEEKRLESATRDAGRHKSKRGDVLCIPSHSSLEHPRPDIG